MLKVSFFRYAAAVVLGTGVGSQGRTDTTIFPFISRQTKFGVVHAQFRNEEYKIGGVVLELSLFIKLRELIIGDLSDPIKRNRQLTRFPFLL